MTKKSGVSKDVVDNDLKVEFIVTGEMVRLFSELTSDFSSLHTDKTFARRSMYREIVAHGMIPVLFIGTLNLRGSGPGYRFRKISANLSKPVFAGDRLSLSAEAVKADVEVLPIEYEYVVRDAESGSVITTGRYETICGERVNDPGTAVEPDTPVNNCVVVSKLQEQSLSFDRISKGDEGGFEFLITDSHLNVLSTLLKKGLPAKHWFDPETSDGQLRCCLPNLLAASLFSTFSGMCIPGRYGIFTYFNILFEKNIRLHHSYSFTGKVRSASPSTSSISENVTIHDLDNNGEQCANGTIDAGVKDKVTVIPTVDSMKNDVLDPGLRDKVVLVTGASRGVGEATAKLFSLYGARVAVNYFQGENDANRIVNDISGNRGKALAVRADVSDREQVKGMVDDVCEAFGGVDILVNNAVYNYSPVKFTDLKWSDVQRDLDIVVKGAFNCCQEVIPRMVERKRGKIININTVATDIPPPNHTKYVVAKSGLVGLTRCLAVELAKYNIQVNMVSPSFVETDLTKHLSRMAVDNIIADTPMGRSVDPVEVANAVIFLASSMASFTTGQKIVVSGGNPPFV